VVRVALPRRPPGLDNHTVVGGGAYARYYGNRISEEELLGPIPLEPTFDQTLDDIRAELEAKIRKVTVPKDLSSPHPAIAKLLRADEARRQRSQGQNHVFSWDAPRYASPIQQRRLRIMSAVFLAVASAGCRGEAESDRSYGEPVENFSVTVGHQPVRLRASIVEVKDRTVKGEAARTAQRIRIALDPGDPARRQPDGQAWEDEEERLEQQVRNIAVAVVLKGELQHRNGVMAQHKWRIEAKADLIERRRKENEEAERKARERREMLEKQRVERLLGEAEALRKAEAIRRYVDQVCTLNAASGAPASATSLEEWAVWALAQADRIDPVRNGAFRKSFGDDA